VRVGVYAGTFDPITYGHVSVIERAAQLFDRVVVLIAVNPEKQPLFSGDERAWMIRAVTRAFSNVECAATAGYVVDFARGRGARHLVRGVRSSTDVEREIALANANHALAPEIETVFIPAHPALSEVSSSALKALVRQGADVSAYCPRAIVELLEGRLDSRRASSTRDGEHVVDRRTRSLKVDAYVSCPSDAGSKRDGRS
jgi:pantetheine-phosphate adenylyltransferase